MPTIKVTDEVDIFYKDWGTGQPIVFCHGWPLTADAWDPQMLFLAIKATGRLPTTGEVMAALLRLPSTARMDAYADDLAALVNRLDLRDIVLVGHSTGGGEVARYIGRHGCARVAKAVLIGSVPPVMLRSPENPEGLPKDVSTPFAMGLYAIVHNFTETYPCLFLGSIARVRSSPKGFASISGCKGC